MALRFTFSRLCRLQIVQNILTKNCIQVAIFNKNTFKKIIVYFRCEGKQILAGNSNVLCRLPLNLQKCIELLIYI